MPREVSIEPIGLGNAGQIARLFNEDEGLRADLGMASRDNDADSVLATYAAWERTRRARCFAIVAGGRAAGTISLTDIDPEARAARVGYWVASARRGEGIASAALGLLLEVARAEGVELVSSKVGRGNAASRRVLEKRGASGEPLDGETIRYELRVGASAARDA